MLHFLLFLNLTSWIKTVSSLFTKSINEVVNSATRQAITDVIKNIIKVLIIILLNLFYYSF